MAHVPALGDHQRPHFWRNRRGSDTFNTNNGTAPYLIRRNRHCQHHYAHAKRAVGVAAAAPEAAQPAAAAAAANAPDRLVERCTASDWRRPLLPLSISDGAAATAAPPAAAAVVALGKFDALHRGHRALARAAAALTTDGSGPAVLLSFSGMAEVLGWPARLPLVPPCDRSRVLALWASQLASPSSSSCDSDSSSGGGGGGGGGSGAPSAACSVRQRYVPFACVRSLSPEAFVALLAEELRAGGVVAGRNYRFGYKAAGDIATLERLAAHHNLAFAAVGLVSAGPGGKGGSGTSTSSSNGSNDGGDEPPVSSSMIRELLAAGDVARVAALMARPYRLVGAVRWRAGGGGGDGDDGDDDSGSSSSSSSSSKSSETGGSSSQAAAQAFSTSSMDGSETEAAPLRLLGGGGGAEAVAGVLVAAEGLLNAAPGPGRYSAMLTVHCGAGPGDELLALEQQGQQEVGGAEQEWNEGGSNGAGHTGRCVAVVEVTLGPKGAVLPAAPVLRAIAPPHGAAGRALVVLDFAERLGD